jgi:hypothetical protein
LKEAGSDGSTLGLYRTLGSGMLGSTLEGHIQGMVGLSLRFILVEEPVVVQERYDEERTR